MRQTRVYFLAAMLILVAGCGYSGLPQSGDVVSPAIVQGINWTAGKHGEIWAELSARDALGNSRRLGFAASPVNNPVANVVFYGADGKSVGQDQVELTERC